MGGSQRHAEAGAEDAVVVPEAAVALPVDVLQGGEIVILLLKPSPWFIVLSCLRTVLTVGALAALGLWLLRWSGSEMPLGLGRYDIVVVGVAVVGVRLFWQFLEWMERYYVLTDRRVIVIQGVLRRVVFEAPLKRIQHTLMLFSLRERFFGLGTIGFATAGTGAVEAYWRMLARPTEVHQEVVRALERYR